MLPASRRSCTATAWPLRYARDRPSLETTRRIETRLLTKQKNEWACYSYVWNDAQDDAVLAPAEGLDKPSERPQQRLALDPFRITPDDSLATTVVQSGDRVLVRRNATCLGRIPR